MRIGFVIYNGMTTLDFLGVYDAVTRLDTMGYTESLGFDLDWDVCSFTTGVEDATGLGIVPTSVDESLEWYEVVVVPGGFGTRELVEDEEFVDWIRTARGAELKSSVCTGSLLLGAAGFLEGKTATTHPEAFDQLEPYCAEVSDQRIVDEGDVITARGVTSSIDLGIYLCQKFTDAETRREIQEQMDYKQDKSDENRGALSDFK